MARARSVLTIGSFDGVHLAHAALVRRARQIADEHQARTIVLSFEPHPATLLRPHVVPPRLTTFEYRSELLRAQGADEVVRLEPTPELLAQSAESFVEGLVVQFSPLAIVEGPDFHFGKGRSGTVETLRTLGQGCDFAVHVQEPIEAALTDNTVVRVSSTMTRWLLEQGRVRDAAILLGREYSVEGVVVTGDRRGRTIGFPTANLQTPCLVPADGVYGGTAELEDGRRFVAAISVGRKPTFGDRERALEAYLLNVNPDGQQTPTIPGLPEYGWRMRLTISHWLRDQAKFGSAPELIEQMRRDCQRILTLAGSSAESAEGIAACP